MNRNVLPRAQGAGSVPQSVQLEKQQALIEQLTRKLNLHVNDDDIAHASVDDLRSKVDDAVAEVECVADSIIQPCGGLTAFSVSCFLLFASTSRGGYARIAELQNKKITFADRFQMR